ncbi:MAG: RNA 2',3'-cyclic phosphodiesterase [Candidatus Omnitrophota bacterium]
MRAFIAIELPQDIKDSISRLQAKLKASGADVKWVPPSNIHLTLKFVGEIDATTQNGVCVLLNEIAAHTPPFTIRLAGLGAFPGSRSPRIIWVGLSQGQDQTKTIVDQLESGLEKYGIGRENRPFSSHITIGRVRSQKNMQHLTHDMSETEATIAEKLGEFKAGKITLFKSTLLPNGPVYEILQETSLNTI